MRKGGDPDIWGRVLRCPLWFRCKDRRCGRCPRAARILGGPRSI